MCVFAYVCGGCVCVYLYFPFYKAITSAGGKRVMILKLTKYFGVLTCSFNFGALFSGFGILYCSSLTGGDRRKWENEGIQE